MVQEWRKAGQYSGASVIGAVTRLFVPVLYYVPRHVDVLGTGDIPPRIFNLGTRCRRVVSFTPDGFKTG
jgi:hypothetical protein